MAEAGAYSGNPLAAATAAAAVAAAAPPPRAHAPPHEHGRVPAPALPAAHALPRQDPPRQGSRPPHNGPHHARREHHPEPPEESSRLPEGVSGLNIQLDGGSGTPIIEQLAEAIAANYGRVIEVLTRLPSLTTAALAVAVLTVATTTTALLAGVP